jgi:hypothetical protein
LWASLCTIFIEKLFSKFSSGMNCSKRVGYISRPRGQSVIWKEVSVCRAAILMNSLECADRLKVWQSCWVRLYSNKEGVPLFPASKKEREVRERKLLLSLTFPLFPSVLDLNFQ